MPSQGPNDALFAASLTRTERCPPVERLESLLGDQAPPTALQQHVRGCAHCQTELALLRSFTSGDISSDQEAAAVAAITARLRAGMPFRTAVLVDATVVPWWQRLFGAGWFRPAALGLAMSLLLAGVALQWRQSSRPGIDVAPEGYDTVRSGALLVVAPVGDLSDKPDEIRWQSVPNAARYTVQILAVDRTVLWSGQAAGSADHLDLPAEAKALAVPAKTLLLRVEAFGADGRKVADSNPIRFRYLHNLYNH